MSEPIDVWVARDKRGLFPLALYFAEPRWVDRRLWDGPRRVTLFSDYFPNIKPGECRRMRLVDAPETGEEKA